jgi:hypothetical protein
MYKSVCKEESNQSDILTSDLDPALLSRCLPLSFRRVDTIVCSMILVDKELTHSTELLFSNGLAANTEALTEIMECGQESNGGECYGMLHLTGLVVLPLFFTWTVQFF